MNKEAYQYSWTDGENYSFMHCDTFEEVQVPKEEIEDYEWLLEGQKVKLVKFNNKVIGVELPVLETYEVVREVPGKEYKNEKAVILNCGAEVLVPTFVQVGTKIRVKTDEKTYYDR
jgi:elongation factor P